MDYDRVYREFIDERRKRPPPDLAERHHITPQHVGGGDGPENIIKLAPADHFFAHLLLAKIYGGRLWVPVVLWCGGNRDNWRARKSRLNYAWAARAASKRMRGRGAWQYDGTEHSLKHEDGRTARGTQFDLSSVIGGTKSGLNLLLKRRIATYLGWYIDGDRPDFFGRGRPGNHHPMADQRVHHWVNVDGRDYRGTRVDFCAMSGVSKKSACMIVGGQQVISKGWTLYGAKIPTRGGATHRHQGRAQHSMV